MCGTCLKGIFFIVVISISVLAIVFASLSLTNTGGIGLSLTTSIVFIVIGGIILLSFISTHFCRGIKRKTSNV
jgi:hypothetical protein